MQAASMHAGHLSFPQQQIKVAASQIKTQNPDPARKTLTMQLQGLAAAAGTQREHMEQAPAVSARLRFSTKP
jgi:hypothetical protein